MAKTAKSFLGIFPLCFPILVGIIAVGLIRAGQTASTVSLTHPAFSAAGSAEGETGTL
jgi:hypothetical protein